MNAVNTLSPVTPEDIPVLLQVWEASVRATHDFLPEEDIIFFKETIQRNNLFEQVNITVARNEDGVILGFLGLSDDTIEMLFLDPIARSRGLGRLLVQYAFDKGIRKVDVNEQNKQAVGFYEHMGFRCISRSAVDGLGKPYPVLHMILE